MEVKDLMVGDLVYIHEPECKGHRIDAIDELDGQVGADGEVYDECDIRPIPLTEEILVKNGWDFTKSDYSVYCKEDTNGDAELSKDEYGFYWSINCDEYVILRIDYVHQLQHLLRLCGIDKELVID